MRLRSSQAVPHGWSTIRSRSQLAFLGVIVVQAIAVLALIIVVFARFDDAILNETLRLCGADAWRLLTEQAICDRLPRALHHGGGVQCARHT